MMSAKAMLRLVLSGFLLMLSPAALGREDTESGHAHVNGMQIYYETSGDGEPLILLHGAYMSIPLMADLITELAKSRKVYALEFQGHGRTADIDRPITYENLADDVAALMDSLGIKDADVVGYSMGGGAGLQLAIRHPDKVRRLVSISAVADTGGFQPAFKRFIPQMSPEMLAGSPIETNYRQIAVDPEGFDALARKLIALDEQEFDWSEEVAGLAMPVLLVAGDADVTTLEHTVGLFRQLGGGEMGDMGKPLPPVRLAVLPASSHTAVIRQIPVLTAHIAPFLRDEAPAGMFTGQ